MLLFHTLLLNLVAIFVAANTGDSWHQDDMFLLVNEELDPIVSPNAQSSHMHKVIGGSNFAASYDQATYQSASCSSGAVQADKSNYWMPALYFRDPDTKKYASLDMKPRFYYAMNRNSPNEPVHPFPAGLRILAGDPNNKDPSVSDPYVDFECHPNADLTDPISANNFNFNNSCKAGMKVFMYFPSCWDGINLYKSDGSHMTYQSIRCPLSHPVVVPQVRLEYTFYPQDYNVAGHNLAGNMYWANGDMTGYGAHADFINGWDLDVLGAALNDSTCIQNNGQSITISGCPVLAKSYDVTAAQNCKPSRGYLAEPTTNQDLVPVDALPGCNLPWGATGSKPTCSPAVAGLDVSALTGTDGAYTAAVSQALTLPTTPGWSAVACVYGSPAISNPVSYVDNAVTASSCQASCSKQGYSYAATALIGSAWNCYCGSTIDMTAGIYPNMCTATCPGNSSQTCGGTSYVYQLYYAPPGTVITGETAAVYDSSYIGCYNNDKAAGLTTVSTYSFTSSSMTTEVCLSACILKGTNWALTTTSTTCYCGNSWTYGTGAYVPDTQCTTKCSGNSTEICGDYYRSSVYNITSSQYNHSSSYRPAGWMGCYQETSSRTAIPAGFSWSNSSNTPQLCINECSSLGYTYAGVEQGYYCYCGNTFQGGQELPSSQCATACAGNSTQHCGGSSAIDLYSTSYATLTAATVKASRPSGYLGCFVDTGSTTTLNDYSYTSSSMTIELCQSACAGFGYGYAGLESSTKCKCGSAPPSTQQWPADMKCTTTCGGNSTEFCGANGFLEAYNVSVAASTQTNSTSSADYVGCYTDNGATKGLSSYSFSLTGMTRDICRTACAEIGYTLSASEGGTNCYCGNSWAGGAILPATSCSTTCPGNSSQICGASNIASVWYTRNAPAIATHPAGWLGCYQDNTNRILTGYSYGASSMTAAVCQTACTKAGYSLAGTEGNNCYCDNVIENGGTRAPSAMCNVACGGNANQTCGGSWKMDLYNSSALSTTASGSASYEGCYSDYSVLNSYSFASDYMSVDICERACYARGYAYAGLRNSGQCLCGNTSPAKVVTNSNCVSACSANSTQNCGTASYAAVYFTSSITSGDIVLSPNATGYVGCFTDVPSRALSYSAYSSNTLTNQACATNCKALGYAYSGTEQTNCYCGAKLNNTLASVYQVADADCTAVCSGGGSMCGGSWKLSVYDTSIAASASTTAAPEGYKGCFGPGTIISAPPFSYSYGTITTEQCRRNCRILGYSVASLLGGNTCSCASSAIYGSAVAPALCNSPCGGNANETCGGTGKLAVSIYDTTGAGSVAPAGFPANYIGCYSDSSSNRLLPSYSYASSGMTSTLCKAACSARGYSVYGTEAATQCFCGTALPTTSMLSDSSCNVPCGGSSSETCGASGRISIYSSTYNVTVVNSTTSTSVSSTASIATSTSKSVNATSSIATANATSTVITSSTSKVANASTAAVTTNITAAATAPLTAASSSSSKSAVSSVVSASTSASASSSVVASSSSSKASSASSSTSSAVTSPVTSSSSAKSSVTASVTVTSSTSSSASAITSATTAKSSSSVVPTAASTTSTSTSASSSKASSSVAASSVTSSSSAKAASSSSAVTATVTSTSSTASKSSSSSSVVTATVTSATTSASKSSSSVTSSSTTSAKASTITSSTTLSAAGAVATADGTLVGCYTQSTNIVTAANMTCDSLTPSMCKIWCNANGYTYAGMRSGNYCGCTNDISQLTSVASTQCSSACVGDSSTSCGGTSAFNIYKSSASLAKIRRTPSQPFRHKRRANL